MRPLINTPSLGTIGAWQSWVMVAALMLYSPAFTFPLLMWCMYAVSVCAAWEKAPSGFWRTFVIASLLAGIAMSLFVAPGNKSIELDGFITTPLLVWTVYIGFALVPLALFSCTHTAYRRMRVKFGDTRKSLP